MGHVFISYSRDNQTLINKLVQLLSVNNVSVWIDHSDIPGGVKWRRQIVDAIETADAVLLALSPSSVKSDNVRKELDVAEDLKKPVLPVLVEATPIPKDMAYQLAGLQVIDLTSGLDAGKKQLLAALALNAIPAKSNGESAATIGSGQILTADPTSQRSKADQHLPAAELESLYNKGEKLYLERHFEVALRHLRQVAERGHPLSQIAVGFMYASGEPWVRDCSEALQWFRRAAEQGQVGAYQNIGCLYKWGSGVPEDMQQAARYFRKAAEGECAAAQNSLGVLYRIGQGVPQDFNEAAKWYCRAAEQGNPTATDNLCELYEKGLGVEKNSSKAAMLRSRSAQQREKHRLASLKEPNWILSG